MSEVHITLVGGQPAPVYHGIVSTNPEKVEFIYSKNSKGTLDILKKEIHIATEEHILSPTDPYEIKTLAESLAKKYQDDDITVNISSGLKSWTYFFSIIFCKLPKAAVIYMDQNNVLWNYQTMKGTTDFVFNMHTVFRLYGNSIENNYRHFEDYTKEDVNNISKIEEIRKFNFNDFNKLTTVLSIKQTNILKNQESGLFKLPSDSFVKWQKPQNGKDGCVQICLYNRYDKAKDFTLKSPNIVNLVFNAGWFEYKIAKLLSNWSKVHEICLNCRFPFRPNVDKNETDIIINTGSKILFVECKTQITHTTDIDKFRTVVKEYGGIGSKGLFVTDSPMTDIAKQKCAENGILSFSLKEQHLGMNEDQALFMLLDHELFNINTK